VNIVAEQEQAILVTNFLFFKVLIVPNSFTARLFRRPWKKGQNYSL